MAKTLEEIDYTGKISAPSEELLKRFETRANVEVSMTMFPNFMDEVAKQRRTWNKFLLVTPTSLGDCICSEPTVRFVSETYKNCEISLATNYPELFGHLKFKEIMNEKEALLMIDNHSAYDKYRVCRGYYGPGEPQSLYFPNFSINIVDYISQCMIRRQLPIKYKQPFFDLSNIEIYAPHSAVVIHPGKTWPSRTIPGWYWDQIIDGLADEKIPVIVVGTKLGTVKLNSDFEDARDELTILETIKLCSRPRAVLTNDSSVLHMAAAGYSKIGYFSTVKEPEYVTHWRTFASETGFGLQMKNFAKWSLCNDLSLTTGGRRYDEITDDEMRSMLPDFHDVVNWVKSARE